MFKPNILLFICLPKEPGSVNKVWIVWVLVGVQRRSEMKCQHARHYICKLACNMLALSVANIIHINYRNIYCSKRKKKLSESSSEKRKKTWGQLEWTNWQFYFSIWCSQTNKSTQSVKNEHTVSVSGQNTIVSSIPDFNKHCMLFTSKSLSFFKMLCLIILLIWVFLFSNINS